MTTSWHLEAEAQVGRGVTARRFRLANGLGLVTAIDRRAPIVALQTWYRVGSRHERPGATGMAHLFEHLMFGQTERLPPGEFDRLVERTGGESNAATWVDWTYYRLSLPARDLPLGIRLESERMQLLVLEPTPVEAERDVVTNERRERVEDDVDGWLDELDQDTAGRLGDVEEPGDEREGVVPGRQRACRRRDRGSRSEPLLRRPGRP
jgi:zinc protease